MTEPLTKRQHEVLAALQTYHAAHGYYPTYGELAESLGVTTQTAHGLVSAVEEKGYLKTYPGKHRSMRISA